MNQLNHLYINHTGCQIGIKQNQLTIKKTDDETLSYPLRQIERITIATVAHFTGAALKTLFKENIPTLFCSPDGYFRGRLTAGRCSSAQVHRRARQYQILADDTQQTALAAAQAIIRAKIQNQQRVLSQGHAQVAPMLSNFAEKVSESRDLDTLRGYEGCAAKLYFSHFGTLLEKTPFSFCRRIRPARDPVNALLSLGYALLQNEVEMAIDWHGLDRFVGFLHRSDGSQPSLILDLMEPFRPLADRLALKFLRQTLTLEDFAQQADKCRLKDQARAAYLKVWEDQMNERKMWLGETSTYRRLIERQVLAWVHLLEQKTNKLDAWTLHG